jgi:hypothetical protein
MNAAWIAMTTACLCAPAPPEKPKIPFPLERKLHATWRSESACGGTVTLRADGTYEHRRQGPGGDTSSGRWEVRWDALPPTLVLTCEDSTDPGKIGRREAKVEGLNDESLVLAHPKAAPSRFRRVRR